MYEAPSWSLKFHDDISKAFWVLSECNIMIKSVPSLLKNLLFDRMYPLLDPFGDFLVPVTKCSGLNMQEFLLVCGFVCYRLLIGRNVSCNLFHAIKQILLHSILQEVTQKESQDSHFLVTTRVS